MARDRGRVEHGVTGIGNRKKRIGGEESRRNLSEVAVERCNMQHRYATEVGQSQQPCREKLRRDAIKRAIFGGLMEDIIAQIGAREHEFFVE